MTLLQRCDLAQAVCMTGAATWFFAAGGTMTTGASMLFGASVLPGLWRMSEIRKRLQSGDRPAAWKLWLCGLGLMSCLVWSDIASQRSQAARNRQMDVVMAICGAGSLLTLAGLIRSRWVTDRTRTTGSERPG